MDKEKQYLAARISQLAKDDPRKFLHELIAQRTALTAEVDEANKAVALLDNMIAATSQFINDTKTATTLVDTLRIVHEIDLPKDYNIVHRQYNPDVPLDMYHQELYNPFDESKPQVLLIYHRPHELAKVGVAVGSFFEHTVVDTEYKFYNGTVSVYLLHGVTRESRLQRKHE